MWHFLWSVYGILLYLLLESLFRNRTCKLCRPNHTRSIARYVLNPHVDSGYWLVLHSVMHDDVSAVWGPGRARSNEGRTFALGRPGRPDPPIDSQE